MQLTLFPIVVDPLKMFSVITAFRVDDPAEDAALSLLSW